MSAVCRAGHVSDEDDYCSVCGAPIAAGPVAASARAVAPSAGGAIAGSAGSAVACPSCGEPREDPDARFCEVCRYDFLERRPGPPPAAARVAGTPKAPPAAPRGPAASPAPVPFAPPQASAPVASAPVASAPPAPVALAANAPVSARPASGAAARWEIAIAVDPALDTEPDPESPCPKASLDRVVAVDRAELLVGRHDEQRDIHPEIPVHDPGASRRHAKFVVEVDGCVALQDLASTNGTCVNDREVPPGARRRLADGDQVTLGRWTRLTLRSRP